MYKQYYNYMRWGIFFTMIDFRIQGFDIFPDIIGYILFAVALGALKHRNKSFRTASALNIVLLIFSIFSIWERPAEATLSMPMAPVNIWAALPLAFLVSVGYIILNILFIYNVLMGCKEIARQNVRMHLVEEADNKFKQFLVFSLAAIGIFLLFIMPFLALIYIIVMFIAGIVITLNLMSFMKSCEQYLD